MKTIISMQFLIVAYAVTAWIVNLVKLFGCDFSPIDKNEIIHLIGLIPGVSMITCWF